MESNTTLAKLAADIVAAYVSKNEVPRADLPKLIHDVFEALTAAIEGKKPAQASVIPNGNKKTIFPDYLICLEDGKRFKSLKRHLRAAYKLSPEQYRAKWNLSADYPMVAPNYAQNSSLKSTPKPTGYRRSSIGVVSSADPDRWAR